MRIALISDLHANIEALDAALERIQALSVEQSYCLGDIVGYHADAEACIERLRERQIRSLAGNHDRAVAGLRSALHFGERARRAVDWTRRRLSAESLAFLGSLPVAELAFEGCFAVHAALHPEPNDELHLSTKERVLASLTLLASGRFGASLCFFGHTHRPVVHRLERGRVVTSNLDSEAVIQLDPERPTLVNPGSLGQPRDGDPRAAFAIYDSERHSVEFHRVAYDWQTCHDKARRAGLFEREPAHVRTSTWLRARVDGGAGILKRAVGRALG